MKKFILFFIIIVLLYGTTVLFYRTSIYTKSLSKIQVKSKLTSKEMANEIVKQLKEKEGMTIEDYIIKHYYRRLK